MKLRCPEYLKNKSEHVNSEIIKWEKFSDGVVLLGRNLEITEVNRHYKNKNVK